MALTEKQHKIRRGGVTATDIVTLAGLSPYGRTPHDVWASKVLGHDDFEETEAIELGLALEPIVVPRVAKAAGLYHKRINPEDLTRTHPQWDRYVATPDGVFTPKHAFEEPVATTQVKVCGLENAGYWGPVHAGRDGIPHWVLAQDVWEMFVYQKDLSYVGALIGTQIRTYKVERTPDLEDLIGALREVADQFWTDYVVTKQPPKVDGSDGAGRMLAALWPQNNGAVIAADAEAEGLAQVYFDAHRVASDHQKIADTALQGLMQKCADNDGVMGQGWRLYLKLRAEQEVSFTRKAYRHPDMRAIKASTTKKGKAAA